MHVHVPKYVKYQTMMLNCTFLQLRFPIQEFVNIAAQTLYTYC